MFKNIRDLGFSFTLLFLIAVGIYWIMDQLQKDYLDQYISILGDKLVTLVPESSEKRALNDLFDQFRTKVENKEVSPQQVEQIAAEIFNLSNLSDSISLAEAEELIRLPEVPLIEEIPSPESKEWRDLESRLENIYKFEQRVRLMPEVRFQVDDKLNILVDKKVQYTLEEAKNTQIIIELENLKNNDAVIWMKSLDSSLAKRKDELIKIRKDEALAQKDKLREMREMLVIKADSIKAVVSLHLEMDSVHVNMVPKIDKIPTPRN